MVYWAPTVYQALKNFPLTFSEFSCLGAWAVISIYRGEKVMLGEVKYRPNVIQLRTESTGMPGSEPKFLTCTIFCKKSRGLRLTCAGILSQGRGGGGETSEVPREVRWRPGRVCWRRRDVGTKVPTQVPPHSGWTREVSAAAYEDIWKYKGLFHNIWSELFILFRVDWKPNPRM